MLLMVTNFVINHESSLVKNMIKQLQKLKYFFMGLMFTIINFLLVPVSEAADVVTYPSLGGASHNILQPVSLFTRGFYSLCYIAGGMFLFGAVIQYKNHRNTPGAVRLSTPVTLFLLGAALILLPLISKVSPSAGAALGH